MKAGVVAAMEINMMEELFRSYVDFHMGLLDSHDLVDICQRHNILYDKNNLYNSHVKKELSNKLKGMFDDHLTFPKNNLHKLRRQIVLKYIVEDKPLEPYLEVVETLDAYLPNDTMMNQLNDKDGWMGIIKTVIDLSRVDDHVWAHPLEFYSKDFCEGNSAKYLQDKGYQVQVNNCEIGMEESEYHRIASDIEKLVAYLGGYNVAESILGLMKPKFSIKLQRYRITREKTTIPLTANPQLPFGYLLNLCVKHFAFYNYQDENRYNDEFRYLIELSTAFISVMDIQEFSQYADMFIDNDDFINYIYKNILFDSIIGIRQFNPHYISDLIKGMLGPFLLEDSVQKSIGLSAIEIAQIVEYILNKDEEKQTFIIVTSEELEKAFSNIKKSHINRFMNLLTHNGSINKKYISPTSLNNFGEKPLMPRKKGKLLLLDRTLCAISFYDAICDFIRSIITDFDDRLGYQLEDYIKSMLDAKGIEYKSGYYGDDECDLVVETDKKIVFMEMKKKPLTRLALAGSGVKLFSDITKGLLSSQIQLGKHELELLQKGKITLRKFRSKKKAKEHSEQVVEYRDRIIERISVNAWDYGFLNDRMATQNVLQFLTYLEVRATDLGRDSELNELRKASTILLKQFEELKKMPGRKREDLRDNYFDSSFLSLQQLMMIINDSNSKDEFIDNMLINKHIITGAGDFYFEYDYLKGL